MNGGDGTAVRVVVADDQTSVRDGLVALLGTLSDFTVVGTAADGASVVEVVERETPDAVLMDLRMPGIDGIQATEHLARIHPGIAVVVLTTFADDESIFSALQAGARGYLTKNASRADIARALHAAVNDQFTLDRDVHQTLLSAALRGHRVDKPVSPHCGPWPDGLTDREGEILALIAEGHNNREIAARLVIGNATVKTHINRIFAKIAVSDRRSAIDYARRLLSFPEN